MPKKKRKLNITKMNLLVDIAIFGGFLIAFNPDISGLTIHEWLSVALVGGLTIHLLMHWKWIVAMTARFFKKTAMQARINYVLNAAFLFDVAIIIVTGLMISERVMPILGLEIGRGGLWEKLHEVSANMSIILLSLHIALHWKWILNAVRRYLLTPTLSFMTPKPTYKKKIHS